MRFSHQLMSRNEIATVLAKFLGVTHMRPGNCLNVTQNLFKVVLVVIYPFKQKITHAEFTDGRMNARAQQIVITQINDHVGTLGAQIPPFSQKFDKKALAILSCRHDTSYVPGS